jgi:glycosyltransferase involved in cell wall biosynthesis
MKIALVTPEYITESNFDGGLSNYLYRLAQGMKYRGHQVEIFTCSERNETIDHCGILVHRIKVKCSLLEFIDRLTRYRFKKVLGILALSYCMRKHFLKRHRVHPYALVQQSNFLACALLLTFNRPAPVVTRISSYEPLWRKFYRKPLTNDQRLVEWLELLAIRRSDAVYAPSKLLSRILRDRLGIRVDVLRPPFLIETSFFDERIYSKYLSRKKYFLFFGTIGVLKGGEVLAKSLAKILSQYPRMYFVFIGKISADRSMLPYILQQAGIYKKQIIYLGVLPHSQLYPIVKHSHAVVLPSLVDNLPNTLLEAMALGKIVIGTRGTSFEEIIDDKISGILVRPNNPDELRNAMQHVWKMSNAERENIGKAAQERVSYLSSEHIFEEYEQYIQKIV